MKINMNVKDLSAKFVPLLNIIKRYFKFIFAALLVCAYGFLVLKIGVLSKIEPSEEQIEEVLKDVKRPKVDKEAVAQIEALEDQNVQVQALFKQARDNPFQE